MDSQESARIVAETEAQLLGRIRNALSRAVDACIGEVISEESNIMRYRIMFEAHLGLEALDKAVKESDIEEKFRLIEKAQSHRASIQPLLKAMYPHGKWCYLKELKKK